MLKKIVCAFVLVSAITKIACADEMILTNQISAEVGVSAPVFGGDKGTQTIGLFEYRYTPSWYYIGGIAGGWMGSRHTGIAGAQVGVNYKNFSLGTGPAYITDMSEALGTHQQILSSLRWNFSDYPIFIAFNHVSNGSKLFNTNRDKPNDGENFFSVGYIHQF